MQKSDLGSSKSRIGMFQCSRAHERRPDLFDPPPVVYCVLEDAPLYCTESLPSARTTTVTRAHPAPRARQSRRTACTHLRTVRLCLWFAKSNETTCALMGWIVDIVLRVCV